MDAFETHAAASFRAIVGHDLRALHLCALTDPLACLIALDRAHRTAANLGRDDDLAWVEGAERAVRARVPPEAQRWADVDRLRLGFMLGELCLVAGAGLSQGAGFPGWKDLVVECLELAAARSPDGAAQPLRTLAAELRLRTTYRTEELVRATQLFTDAAGPQTNGWLAEVLGRRFVSRPGAFLAPRSPLHDVVVRAAVSERPVAVTPGLNAVLTYNFDDLIELHLAAHGRPSTVFVGVGGRIRSFDYGALATAGPLPEPSYDRPALRVFHPHGFAAQYAFPGSDQIDCVFSERQYALAYGDDRRFTRQIQLQVFTDVVNLFLGSSFEDGDMCAELGRAAALRPGWRHYCFMREPDALAGPAPYAEASERLLRLGVRPLFFASFEEMASALLHVTSLTHHSERHWRYAWTALRGLAPDRVPALPRHVTGGRADQPHASPAAGGTGTP